MILKKFTENEINSFNKKVLSRGLIGQKLIEYKKNLHLTPKQKDILVGTLLGDASIRVSKANYCVKFEQIYTRFNYVKHLYNIFEPFVGTGPKLRIIKNSFHKDYGVSCWFRTYSHIKFKYYENIFYCIENNKRRKMVPKNIHKLLTSQALAYWFMDDGSYIFGRFANSLDNLYTLNTQGFTLSEQKILMRALKRNFKIDAQIKRDKKYYRLIIQSSSTKNFRTLIQPYIHSTFLYKLYLI